MTSESKAHHDKHSAHHEKHSAEKEAHEHEHDESEAPEHDKLKAAEHDKPKAPEHEKPKAAVEAKVTGAELLKLLQESGSGDDKLAPAVALLEENPDATAKQVLVAISKLGPLTENTVKKGLKLAGGMKVTDLVDEANEESKRMMKAAKKAPAPAAPPPPVAQ